ncbi:hypothetical protein ALC57_08632 [Trachymyrmex cornetzi]|uniref:Uncharacterized protein n=1 Tax=Trachymyrmex cornetzi TaxID=471704 RepID=A0A195E229_9HYME|nr:hypothetical protein ALC57_08632 [Trachymyrmex cornetzi]
MIFILVERFTSRDRVEASVSSIAQMLIVTIVAMYTPDLIDARSFFFETILLCSEYFSSLCAIGDLEWYVEVCVVLHDFLINRLTWIIYNPRSTFNVAFVILFIL